MRAPGALKMRPGEKRSVIEGQRTSTKSVAPEKKGEKRVQEEGGAPGRAGRLTE